ncbi:TPA: PLP-dependent aminotransferase family protein [Salmonella enterica subsp. enterica serovar Enteritidis]|nr:PLP-dependent aminotransferase family protein [Salmonella enterica subsp. enterica serovar Enteritidis]
MNTANFESIHIMIDAQVWRNLPLHLRLYHAFRQLVISGALVDGAKLPSARALAQQLRLSRDTVENAYSQLQRDGFMTRRQGAGSFASRQGIPHIQGQHSLPPSPRQTPTLSARWQTIADRAVSFDARRMQTFTLGLAETRNFPQTIWQNFARQIQRERAHTLMLHGDPQGEPELRQQIAHYLNFERGAKVDAQQIVIVSGARQAFWLCGQLLAEAGQSVVMENPGYPGARQAFSAAQLNLLPIEVDRDGIRVDKLPPAPLVYVTPSHQFPSGHLLSLARRHALIDWARTHNAWIIEDDYDSEFHYNGAPVACMQGLDREQRTLYVGTFSKTLYPGLRIGYLVVPASLAAHFAAARNLLDGATPALTQLTLARFIASGHFAAHIRTMRSMYAVRQACLAQAINQHLSDWVTPVVTPGGLQMPCWLHEGIDEQQTLNAARRAGLNIAGMRQFWLTHPAPTGWLLGFAAFTPYEIENGVKLLRAALCAENARQAGS